MDLHLINYYACLVWVNSPHFNHSHLFVRCQANTVSQLVVWVGLWGEALRPQPHLQVRNGENCCRVLQIRLRIVSLANKQVYVGILKLSQNEKVLRQLFCVLRKCIWIKSVENFLDFQNFGAKNPSPTQKAALRRVVFCWHWALRPEFQKDGFSNARFPVSSRAFSD